MTSPGFFSNLARHAAVYVKDRCPTNGIIGCMRVDKHVDGHVYKVTGSGKQGMQARICYTQARRVWMKEPLRLASMR